MSKTEILPRKRKTARHQPGCLILLRPKISGNSGGDGDSGSAGDVELAPG
jgi:hypothetical protein